jgi:hypothetical protein
MSGTVMVGNSRPRISKGRPVFAVEPVFARLDASRFHGTGTRPLFEREAAAATT